jgi:hypothetical protein
MTHIEQRLQERHISIDYAKLCQIAKFAGRDAAVLLGSVPCQNDDNTPYTSRELSNGELVVLIVRNNEPKTIMFRRENQPFTAEALRVSKVYTL